jgi:membrane-bound acyltransferase YfiQ involved in biofilm formation
MAEPDEQRDNGEDERERLNRQMSEMLQELRVAMPGVQVLFGFLLTVPFQQGFRRTTEFEEKVYFVTLVAAAVATALLIAPSAFHRITLATGQKPDIIRIGTVQMLLGLFALAVAMNGAVLLVTHFVFPSHVAIATVVVVATIYASLWFVFGAIRRARA